MSVEMTPRPVTSFASPRTGKTTVRKCRTAPSTVQSSVASTGRPLLEHLALEGLAPGRRLEGQHVLVPPAEHLRLRPLQDAQPRLVRHEVGAVPALERHRRRGVVEDRALPAVARLGLAAGAGEDEPRGERAGRPSRRPG